MQRCHCVSHRPQRRAFILFRRRQNLQRQGVFVCSVILRWMRAMKAGSFEWCELRVLAMVRNWGWSGRQSPLRMQCHQNRADALCRLERLLCVGVMLIKMQWAHKQDKDDGVELDAHEVVEEAQIKSPGQSQPRSRCWGPGQNQCNQCNPGGLMWLGPQGEYRSASPAEHLLLRSASRAMPVQTVRGPANSPGVVVAATP